MSLLSAELKYKPVAGHEEEEEDGVVGSNNQDSLTLTPTKTTTKKRKKSPWLSWRAAIIAVLSIGWLATLFAWHKSRAAAAAAAAAQPPQTDEGPLHVYTSTPIPRDVFRPVKKVFQADERYVGGTPEAEVAWDNLVAGHDAVWIENPSQWGLGEGIVAPYDHPNTPDPKPQDFYVISILHQLHCLNMVRFQYYQEKNRRADDTSSSSSSAAEDQEAFKWKVHVEHCFEYLRQGISCGGDLIIEGNSPIKVGEHGHATSVTGWGVEHDCIDFDLLRQFQIDQEAKYNLTWQET